MIRVVPANQRLEPRDRLARSIDLRLVDDAKLLFFDGQAKVRFEQLTLASGLVHLSLEEAVAALSGRLGRIKRKVCVAHQVVGGAVVIIRRDDADRRADRNHRTVDRVRTGKAVDDTLRKVRQLSLGRSFGNHDLELVAAKPPDLAHFADFIAKPERNESKQSVAGRVAKRIVDRLEAVE